MTFGNLHKWVQDMGMTVKHLDSLIPMLMDAALGRDAIVNCDETWCKVRRFNRYTKKYLWVLVNKAQ